VSILLKYLFCWRKRKANALFWHCEKSSIFIAEGIFIVKFPLYVLWKKGGEKKKPTQKKKPNKPKPN